MVILTNLILGSLIISSNLNNDIDYSEKTKTFGNTSLSISLYLSMAQMTYQDIFYQTKPTLDVMGYKIEKNEFAREFFKDKKYDQMYYLNLFENFLILQIFDYIDPNKKLSCIYFYVYNTLELINLSLNDKGISMFNNCNNQAIKRRNVKVFVPIIVANF